MGILALSFTFFAQEIQHDEIVVNIEVPVRIFDRGQFVDDLTIDDFEIYENGRPQKITACYLIKKTQIERQEEKDIPLSPDVSRNFILMFDLWEFFPKVERAIDMFFENVVLQGDSLIILTPVKAYNLKEIAWDHQNKHQIADQLKKIVRKDAVMGNSEYRNTLKDFEEITRELNTIVGIQSAARSYSEGIDQLDYSLQKYQEALSRMKNQREVDEQKLINFSELLKDRSGQKIAFLFCQREFIAQPMPKTISIFESQSQFRPDITAKLSDLFTNYRRDISIDTNKIKKAFSDSSILIHFLYITKPPENEAGIMFKEQSEDIYKAFSEIAKSTGGLIESSANAESSLQKAVVASENYYLLYYRPSEYKRDGKFKNIRIKVKVGKYQITHRSGYIAD